MKITSVKTRKITSRDDSIFEILDSHLPRLRERTIVAVTSKIVSIAEGRIVKIGEISKRELIEKEADSYLPGELNRYGTTLTIKNDFLIPCAGIDESNGNNWYVLWPRNPQKSADKIREYLSKKFRRRRLGVIITDSHTTPMRRGVTGFSLAHSGFSALNDYRGQSDIFGRKLKITSASVADGLAAAAVLVMGEGKEQTPLAVMEDLPFVKFQRRNPNKKELEELRIKKKDDLYGELLDAVKWKRKTKLFNC